MDSSGVPSNARPQTGSLPQWAERALAVIATLVFVVGVPALLLLLVGNPLPSLPIDWDSVRVRLETGTIPAEVLTNVLAMVCWLWWVNLVVSVAVEFVSAYRASASRSLLVLPGSQWLARRLVGAIFVVSSSASAAGIPLLAAAAPAAASSVHVETYFAPGVVAGQDPFADSPNPSLAAGAGDPAASGAVGLHRTVGVERGDTLRSLAEELLGDPKRWREIRDLSVGQRQANGSALARGFTSIQPGQRLALPADALERHPSATAESGVDLQTVSDAMSSSIGRSTDATASSAGASIQPYRVERGDSLWTIAQQHLGDPLRWGEIWELSRSLDQVETPDVYDPDLIWPMTILLLPADAVNVPPVEPGLVEAVVGQVPVDPLQRRAVAAANAPTSSAIVHPDHQNLASVVSIDEPGQAPTTAPEDGAVADLEDAAGPAGTGPPAAIAAPPDSADRVNDASSNSVPAPGDAAGLETGSPTVAAGTINTAGIALEGAAFPTAEEPAPASDGHRPSLPAVALGVGGLGLMAAGFLAAVQRRRSIQWRQRPAGQLPRSAPAATDDLTRRLAAEVESVDAAFADLALRAVAHFLRPHAEMFRSPADEGGIAVRSVEIDESSCWLTLSAATEPPEPFVADGDRWRLDRPSIEPETVRELLGATAVLPSLFTLGARGEGTVLVNAEPGAMVAVGGTPTACRLFLASLVLDLAVSRRADQLHVVCVGFGQELASLDRVVAVATVDEALSAVRSSRMKVAGDSDSAPDLYRRLVDPEAARIPTYLICSPASVSTPEAAERWAQLRNLGAVVVTMASETEAAGASDVGVMLSPGQATLASTGQIARRPDLTDEHFEAFSAILDATSPAAFQDPDEDQLAVIAELPAPPGPVETAPAVALSSVEGPAAMQVSLAAPNPVRPPIIDLRTAQPEAGPVEDAAAVSAEGAADLVGEESVQSVAVPAVSVVRGDAVEDEVASSGATPALRAEDGVEPANAAVASEDDSGDIVLRVLGVVDCTGPVGPFPSTRALDVISYLAFHRDGATADQIKTWVWPPDSPPTEKAFANVMSRARIGLGAGADGEPLLSRAGGDKVYRLDAAVETDFAHFSALAVAAEAEPDPVQSLGLYRLALSLIRGVPFTGGGNSGFAWSENSIRAHVEFALDEAVHRCADLALAIGDVVAVREAVAVGLELIPGCEECYRRRFLVAAESGNRAELRKAMHDLERFLATDCDEPEASDLISANLLALFDELLAQTTSPS